MKKNRPDTIIYLLDITYNGSMNAYYEFFGENVPYAEIEQASYIDLKDMVHEMINDAVKFRKHNREGKILTLKVELNDEEKEKLDYLLLNNKFNFLHNFFIKGIKEYKKEEE